MSEDKKWSLADIFAQSQTSKESALPAPPAQPGSASSFADALFLLSAGLSGLPPVTAPPTIRDRWFKDQNINIDGYAFERCRFDQCRLITEAATFKFRDCYLSPDCRLYFQGPSLKVVKLLLHQLEIQGRFTRHPQEQGVFVALKPDGTFSLE